MKTRFGDRVYKKASPIGGTFGEVSESLRLLRSTPGAKFDYFRDWTKNDRVMGNIRMPIYIEIHPFFDLIMSTECPK